MTETIAILGKDYPVKVGYYAIKHTIKEQEKKGKKGVTMDAILNEGNIEVYEAFLFYGLKLGAKLEGEKFTAKREDMEFWMDDCFTEFVALMPKFFPNAKAAKK